MYVQKKLDKAKAYRVRKADGLESKIDFASNDYLGLAKTNIPSPTLLDGQNTRSSRMLFGQHEALDFVEDHLAKVFGFEAAVLFPTGYQANVGLISAFSGRRVAFYSDELIHASMHDGLRLGVNNRYFYKHNDAAHLEQLLEKHAQESEINIILTEGLFSMDGDAAAQAEIKSVANKFGARIIIDEAHSAGVFGGKGEGLWQNDDGILAKVVTFGKAYAGEGAVVLCSAETKAFLYQYCRALIFSTAPSKSFCQQVFSAVELAQSASENREQLRANIAFFRKNLGDQFIHSGRLMGDDVSPVQALLFDTPTLLEIEKEAEEQNIAIKAIFYPTVAKGEERLRISIHAFNTEKEITQLCALLNSKI
jgi:8-amino-7-oxononanoate synthase